MRQQFWTSVSSVSSPIAVSILYQGFFLFRTFLTHFVSSVSAVPGLWRRPHQGSAKGRSARAAGPGPGVEGQLRSRLESSVPRIGSTPAVQTAHDCLPITLRGGCSASSCAPSTKALNQTEYPSARAKVPGPHAARWFTRCHHFVRPINKESHHLSQHPL